jgi:Peroxiredoxin
MRKRFLNKLIVPFLTGLLWLGTAQAASERLSGPAPDFVLKSASGANVRLSELRGDVVMINFWATWCGPCRQEMPLLEQLYGKYKALGFTLLGVNVEEDDAKARQFLKDVPVSFPVLFDKANEVSKLYKVNAMPSTVLIDRDGNLRYLHRGYVPGTEAEYANQIRELLKE